MNYDRPYILTIGLDHHSFTYFNILRMKHFPAKRNFLQAHLTLFHALPPFDDTMLLVEGCSQQYQRFEIQVTGLMKLGYGVAFSLQSEMLNDLHRHLTKLFKNALTPQDMQSFKPHITIQNKVSPEVANNLFVELHQEFRLKIFF
jgi:2'-5' RNA ligase